MYVADVNPVCSNVADFAFSQLCLSFFFILLFCRKDLKVALIYAVLFCFLMVSCYVALYLKWFKLSAMFVIFGILLPVSLKISRHRRLKRKRERRLLLPLSM